MSVCGSVGGSDSKEKKKMWLFVPPCVGWGVGLSWHIMFFLDLCVERISQASLQRYLIDVTTALQNIIPLKHELHFLWNGVQNMPKRLQG